jgi:hypothetical protein
VDLVEVAGEMVGVGRDVPCGCLFAQPAAFEGTTVL